MSSAPGTRLPLSSDVSHELKPALLFVLFCWGRGLCIHSSRAVCKFVLWVRFCFALLLHWMCWTTLRKANRNQKKSKSDGDWCTGPRWTVFCNNWTYSKHWQGKLIVNRFLQHHCPYCKPYGLCLHMKNTQIFALKVLKTQRVAFHKQLPEPRAFVLNALFFFFSQHIRLCIFPHF